MNHGRMLVIIFLSVFVVFAGCHYFIGSADLGSRDSSTFVSSSDSSLTQTAGITQDEATLTGGPLGNTGGEEIVWAPVDTVIGMRIWAEAVDWDEVLGNDGLIVHFLFYDSLGRIVLFEKEIPAQIEIRSPDTNTYYRDITTTEIFKGQTEITSAEDGLPYQLRGIRIPFSLMTFYDDTRGIGTIKMEVNLPNGRVLTDYDTYLYTTP